MRHCAIAETALEPVPPKTTFPALRELQSDLVFSEANKLASASAHIAESFYRLAKDSPGTLAVSIFTSPLRA